MVLTALDGPDLAAAITRRDQGDTDANALADTIRDYKARLDELAAAFADGDITRDQLRIATKRLTDRIITHTPTSSPASTRTASSLATSSAEPNSTTAGRR